MCGTGYSTHTIKLHTTVSIFTKKKKIKPSLQYLVNFCTSLFKRTYLVVPHASLISGEGQQNIKAIILHYPHKSIHYFVILSNLDSAIELYVTLSGHTYVVFHMSVLLSSFLIK